MTLIAGPQSEDALALLRRQGLSTHPQPDHELPLLPPDLTAVGDEDLMVLFGALTAYADFISVQVACAQIDERSLEKHLSIMEARKMLASGGKSENRVTFARAQVATDADVLAAKDAIERAHAYRKVIETLYANVERDSALVSRELTRRTSAGPRRSSRW